MREDSPRCRGCKGSHDIITTSKQESARWGPTNPYFLLQARCACQEHVERPNDSTVRVNGSS